MKLVSSKEILRTKIFWVTEDEAVEPGGFEIKRTIVQHPGSAVILPVDRKGNAMLILQYRLPARDYLWEIPAGRVDPGETPLQAARRELAEETGLRAKIWTKAATYYPSPGFLAEQMTLFIAKDLRQGDPKPMEDERIQTRWFTVKEIDHMIRSGKIQDGKTLIGFLDWQRYHRSKKTPAVKRAPGN